MISTRGKKIYYGSLILMSTMRLCEGKLKGGIQLLRSDLWRKVDGVHQNANVSKKGLESWKCERSHKAFLN